MEQIWFKKWGWFYLPASLAGYIITILAFFFMLPIVISIDRNAHSVTDELYSIFVFASCTAFWWKWIAEKTSK